MDEDKIIERLNFHNSWWTMGQVPTALVPTYHREVYPKIVSYLDLDRVILLKGPRRVGKSTIFYQLIDELIKSKNVLPKNILYLTFDDPLLRLDLFEIIKIFEKLSGESLNETPLKYIFLDEVHFLPNWASSIKIFYDKKFPLKIFGSGSSASLLIKQSENLAGRTVEETILPLSFLEWKKYFRQKSSAFGQNDEINLREYLKVSGFMHLLDIPEKEVWMKMLTEDVVTKALYKDAVQIFGIREPATLERLFSYLANATSGLANILKLSNMLGTERIITSNYLSFLENSLLVFPLRKYSRRIRESLRSQEKIHVIDQGFGQIYLPPSGAILESVVARHVWEKFPTNTYFWREKHEVDIVLKTEGKLLPIEVKESKTVSVKELAGLLTFAHEFRQKKGLVVYFGKPYKKIVDNIAINFVPVWKFLENLGSYLVP